MTIDERLDRLTERHEALTQSIELQMLDTRENTRNIATLSLLIQNLYQTVQDNSKTVSELSKTVEATSKTVEATSKTVEATSKTVREMASSIDTLGRIAEIHEHRLDSVEEG